MEALFKDIRFAFRLLLKSPAFTAVAVLTFALGIGANTAIFSVVNAVLLRPLPYPRSDRLVLLRERTPTMSPSSVSFPNYVDWQTRQHSFTDLALFRLDPCNLSDPNGSGTAEHVKAARVTANFLSILGVVPHLGRDFNAADDVPKGHKVVLISDGLWRRRFGGALTVLGQPVLVDGTPREIIGVLSAGVRLPAGASVYVPLDDLRAEEGVLRRDNYPGFSALGRLKPGVSLVNARSDLTSIATDLSREYPASNTGRGVTTQLLLEAIVGEYRQSLHLLLGAVGCVLLIACTNVANLQLAHTLTRGKELAVRTALGASGVRLTRQLLTESAVLALLGGSAGVALAIWALRAIIAMSPVVVPRLDEIRVDLAALAFTAAVSLAAGVLVGVWPAWRIARNTSLTRVLHESARGSSGGPQERRSRAVLVVTQVAVTVMLATAGTLLLKSFWRAQNAHLGFDAHGILAVSLQLPPARYNTAEKLAAFQTELLTRVTALAGVNSAAIGFNVPFDDNEWDIVFHVTGTSPHPAGQEPSAEASVVSADYFKVMNMPLRGRSFSAEDVFGGRGSIIIDESFATRYFPGQDPIGRQIDDDQSPLLLIHWMPIRSSTRQPLTVVGVVPRTRNEAPGEDNIEKLNLPQIYFCAAQYPQESNSLLVRVAFSDPLALAAPVKREIQLLDSDLSIASISTKEKDIASSLASRRITTSLLGAFAVVALVLASVGIYGVMSLSTAQRTRELGIRLALGATRSAIIRLVLGHGIRLIAIGLATGLAGAFAASHTLNSVLYGVTALDLTALLSGVVMIAVVAFIACYLPARRASLLNPVKALRLD